jgi:hypothetical protein
MCLDKTALLDDLVGAQQERLWHRQPDRLGGREIDDQLEFSRLLDRDIGGLGPMQNLVDELRGRAADSQREN